MADVTRRLSKRPVPSDEGCVCTTSKFVAEEEAPPAAHLDRELSTRRANICFTVFTCIGRVRNP